jgi:hypothetical protein
MNVALREPAIGALAGAPPAVKKAFIKQMKFPGAQTATPFAARQEATTMPAPMCSRHGERR